MTILGANQVRALMQETIDTQLTDLEKAVANTINEAARRGDSSVTVSLSSKSSAAQTAFRKKLQDAGYIVKDPPSRDQRDYGYINISWSSDGRQ